MLRCAICQNHSNSSLCSGCRTLIVSPQNPCQVCAKPMLQSGVVCGECQSDPPTFSRTLCVAVYQPPASVWVQQLKFSERMDRARIMADLLAQPMAEIAASVPIIPMPLHHKRLQSRGFNQAYEVARIVARKQQRNILDQHVLRTKNTAMQAELMEKQRQQNVQGAFAVAQPIEASTVMVLDDVMTTGQTMRAVSKCLKKAGVKEVIAVVFARSGN